jgi:hypothetical protein
MKVCTAKGCGRIYEIGGFGLCGMHYLRWTRYGRLHTIVKNRGSGYTIDPRGYVAIWDGDKLEYQHRLIAEKALGKPLPKGAVVHHIDEDKANNHPSNLVICPDQTYHRLIHARMKAYEDNKDS